MDGLFGADFEIDITKTKAEAKKLAKKLEQEKQIEENTSKYLKSKSLSIQERLDIIKDKVLKVLGKQVENTICIRTLDDFKNYIDKALMAGIIAVDTETNNTTDPLNCEMMGLCLYVPGEKQAYIPINHIDLNTKQLLPNQLTYIDCKNQLQRVLDNKVYILMHNGKFDYEVIKKTCNIEIPPDWDTLIGARLIDENKYADKRVGLKYLYTTEIDPAQEKYSIDELFESIPYKYVQPEIFALYAATDSMMTYKVYIWEKEYFDKPENKKLKWLAENIEMPIVQVTAEMEYTGVTIDTVYGERLKLKYNNLLQDLDKKIQKELDNLKPTIDKWRLSVEANSRTLAYVADKSKMSAEKIAQVYNLIDENGKRYKEAKPKVEQLSDPINLASPTQLAILLYDILKAPQVNKNSPRATGEEELKDIAKKRTDLKICQLLIERRGLVKLISTYIEVIPALAKHWKDGRIRYRLSSMGTNTGRFSSGGNFKYLDENENPVTINSINSQNLPSHNPEIRLLFKASTINNVIEADDNEPIAIDEAAEVEMLNGWVKCENVKIGDLMLVNDKPIAVKSINYDANSMTYLFGV